MNEYEALIKKIRTKRVVIKIVYVIAVVAALLVCLPFKLFFTGVADIDYPGTSPWILAVLMILIIASYIFAYALVSAPVYSSLKVECDPKKYLELNKALSKANTMPMVGAVAYTYMGEFAVAIGYASQMIAKGKPNYVIPGYFNKARCEFLLGDVDALKSSAAALGSAIDGCKKANGKNAEAYTCLRTVAELMCAVADDDAEKIDQYRAAVRAWDQAKSTECFMNYMKGIAAEKVGDKDECVYRLMWVRDNCPKTVFAWLADEHLKNHKASDQ